MFGVLDYEKVGRLVADIKDHDMCEFSLFPRVERDPDLSGFIEQKSDLDVVAVEFVSQSGCGDYGYKGTMAFHINDNHYLMYDYSE